MTAALVLLGLVLLAGIAIALLELLIRKPTASAAMFFGVNVISAAAGKSLELANLDGMSVKLADIFFALLAAAAVARFLRWRDFNVGQRMILAFGALALFSLLRGVWGFGIADATNEFRGVMPFVVGALYFSSVLRDSDLHGILKAWIWSGIPLTLLVFIRWAGWLGGVDIGPLEVAYDAPSRVLDGPQTFFLVQTGLVALLSAPRVSVAAFSQRHLGAVFLLVGVLLNRRTAWAALVVALAILIVRGRGLTPRVRRAVMGVAVIVVVLLFGFGGGLVQESLEPGSDERAVAEVEDTGTLNWRIAGWQQIISETREPVEWLVGVPFGAGFSRVLGFNDVDSNPHNFYIQVFGRVGVIGFTFLLVIFLGGVWLLGRRTPGHFQPPHQELFFVLLAMHLIWYVTWAPGMDSGLLTGLLAGYGFRIGEFQRSRGMHGIVLPAADTVGSEFKSLSTARVFGRTE